MNDNMSEYMGGYNKLVKVFSDIICFNSQLI